MKKIIVLVVVLSSLSSYSQDYLYLSDGSELYGSVIHINKKKVYFENSETGKRKWHKKIDRLVDVTDGVPIEFKIRDVEGLSSYLTGEIISGKVSYYIAYKYMPNNGYFGVGYLYRDGDKKALKDLPNSLSTPFYKRMSKYFSDCNTLVSKINNKEFEEGNTMPIIEFYNSNCSK